MTTVEPVIQTSTERIGRIAALVLLVISFLAVAGLDGLTTLYVIPKFDKIFKDFHTTLPDATVFLIQFSDFVRLNWYVSMPMFFGVYTGLFLLALNRERKWWLFVLVLSIMITFLSVLSVCFVTIALFQPLVSLIQSVKS